MKVKRTKALLAGIVGLIFFLAVLQVASSNRISTAGIELSRLQVSVKDVKRQNALLREKLLTLSSLNRIASKAGELGFVEAKSNLYITSPLPLARNE